MSNSFPAPAFTRRVRGQPYHLVLLVLLATLAWYFRGNLLDDRGASIPMEPLSMPEGKGVEWVTKEVPVDFEPISLALEPSALRTGVDDVMLVPPDSLGTREGSNYSDLSDRLKSPARPATGPLKLGLVDMERVYRAYHGTVQHEAALDQEKAKAKAEVDERIAMFNRLREAFNEQKNANKAATAQSEELERLRKEIEELGAKRKAELEQNLAKFRAEILTELQSVVTAISTAEGYDLVFDKSGKSSNGIELVLCCRNGIDFTESVLARLNPTKESTPKRSETPSQSP